MRVVLTAVLLGLVIVVVGAVVLLGAIPVLSRWREDRARAKRERLAYERSESLLALMALITVDPLLAERVYQELGKWHEERKVLERSR